MSGRGVHDSLKRDVRELQTYENLERDLRDSKKTWPSGEINFRHEKLERNERKLLETRDSLETRGFRKRSDPVIIYERLARKLQGLDRKRRALVKTSEGQKN